MTDEKLWARLIKFTVSWFVVLLILFLVLKNVAAKNQPYTVKFEEKPFTYVPGDYDKCWKRVGEPFTKLMPNSYCEGL